MNSDKKLINQIRQLREIRPDSDWAVSVKTRILGHEMIGQNQSIVSILNAMLIRYRIVLAGLLVLLTVGGTAVAAQNALPGEPLYSLKRAAERGVAMVTGKDKIAAANLELAAKRLEEIDLMSQKNMVKNLPVAFEEYKNARVEAKNQVAEQIRKDPDNVGQIVKDAVAAIKDIDNKEKQVYGVLGLEQSASTTVDGAEAASDQAIVASLLDNLKNEVNLGEEQLKDLEQVKALYEAGNYSKALDKYLGSSLNK